MGEERGKTSGHLAVITHPPSTMRYYYNYQIYQNYQNRRKGNQGVYYIDMI